MIVYEAAGQIYIFLSCVFLGAVLGIVWRLTHLPFTKRKAATVICDVLFCVLAVPIVFFALLWFCYGDMRLYCLAGIFAGFFLWLCTTGLLVDSLVGKIYNKILIKILLRKIKNDNDNDGQKNNQEN